MAFSYNSNSDSDFSGFSEDDIDHHELKSIGSDIDISSLSSLSEIETETEDEDDEV